MCRHGWALGYGNYHESYSSILIVALVLWNVEHCLFNKLHTEALINIPMGCCLCVCLSATQCPANKAQHSHLYKKLIILQWEKMLHFNLCAIPRVPLISFHWAPGACLVLCSTEVAEWAWVSALRQRSHWEKWPPKTSWGYRLKGEIEASLYKEDKDKVIADFVNSSQLNIEMCLW